MANFDEAQKITGRHEGGYANNPSDTGGETMLGISRKHHPKWAGWPVVDGVKRDNPRGFVPVLNAHSGLKQLARNYFKALFWDCYRLDEVANQSIANEVYDTGVNCGQATAAKFLQRAINVTNNRGKYAPDVVVDGKVGPATIRSLNAHKRPGDVFKALNALQGAYYIAIAERNETQEIFMASWLSRVNA